MALFKRTKKEEKTDAPVKEEEKAAAVSVPEKKEKKSASAHTGTRDMAGVLRRPRITEKATFQAEKGVYVFEVATSATKRDVMEAVKRFYKVTPRKVRMTKIPPKTIVSRAQRIRGTKPGGKKAYVYLTKGDTIEIV